MATEVVMPKMGYDMTEGKILRWLKREGDEVTRGEAIAEIETGKVDIEVEAFSSGILRRIIAKEGEVIPVGQVMAFIVSLGEAVPEVKAPLHAAQAPERIPASPLARKIASEEGIDLCLVKGTGPGARITKEDIEAYLKTREAIPGAPRPEVVAPRVESPQVEYEERPLSRIRQTIARRMAESKRTIPHFEVTVDIDMAEALKLRQSLNETLGGVNITVTDLIVKAAALALKRHPELNVSYAEEKVRLYKRINIGIAVALEEGLVTPVVTDCDTKPLSEIAQEIHEKAERARAGRVKPEDVVQGTFTISNLGMFDVEEFTAIINPPEAAILAVSSVDKRPAVKEGGIVVSLRMKVTLGVDHRVVDGVQAARFLKTFKQLLEQPLQLLLERVKP